MRGKILDREAYMNLIRVLNAGMISAEQFRDAIFLDEQKNMNSQSVNREQNADMFRYANIWQMDEEQRERHKNAVVSNPLHYEMQNKNPCEICVKAKKLYANNRLEKIVCADHTCPIWLRDHPKSKKKVKVLSVSEWKEKIAKEQKHQNPCAGCKFRKYHDWAEPTWIGFSKHYYDCENPACPMWKRLWWRKNDDGTALLDQAPIKLKRKVQHAAYEFVEKLDEIIYMILEEEE